MVVVATVSWGVFELQRESEPVPELDLMRITLGLRSLPTEPLTIAADGRRHTAARRVPLSTEWVVFHLVGSIRGESPPGTGLGSGRSSPAR